MIDYHKNIEKRLFLMSNWDTKFWKRFYFDDVLLIPAESHVLPNDVSLQTKLAKNLTLNIPIITVDTVTDSKMAIAIARAGGLGVIHKTCLFLSRQRKYAKNVLKWGYYRSILPDSKSRFGRGRRTDAALSYPQGFRLWKLWKSQVSGIINRDMRFVFSLDFECWFPSTWPVTTW